MNSDAVTETGHRREVTPTGCLAGVSDLLVIFTVRHLNHISPEHLHPWTLKVLLPLVDWLICVFPLPDRGSAAAPAALRPRHPCSPVISDMSA